MGIVEGDEPMLRLFSQGVILGPDGNRMSKSRGNVVAPDELVAEWGADAFRCQLMFVGPWDQGGPYNPTGMQGIIRWLNRAWSVAVEEPQFAELAGASETRSLRRVVHRTIREATADMESFSFHTLIARLMELTTALSRARDAGPVDRAAWNEGLRSLLLMMAPLTPHLAEELWERTGGSFSVHQQLWPAFDPGLARDEMVELVVQVNGKVRERIQLAATASEAEARVAALASEKVRQWLDGKEPRKVVFVPGKLLNLVL
ncbi:MAG: hypothetical protein DYG91_14415 [Chloroflexi bacterium CFX7]|nr:hypothetical protein [Chloroflexi bacterium CFX7]